MERAKIKVEKRTDKGKQAAKRVRADGSIPSILYGKDINAAITVSSEGFKTLRDMHFSESTVIDLSIAGAKNMESIPVLIKDVQYHPLTDKVIHIDLLQVSLKEKITVHIPIILKGEAKGKEEGAVLEQILREIEVEGLPLDIPENIEVDISNLEIGHSLHVADLKPSAGITIVTESESTVATLVIKKEEEEEEEELAEEAPTEPEVIKEKKEEGQEEESSQEKQPKKEAKDEDGKKEENKKE
ncbi:MAG: 50S ribosomal protein L25 [Candidatus Omnitrophica bacterium]|nr:50S ribosomal protein L25 [Candidatus Omnitrophota bacterium]MCF7888105.1 50S ribosomal protein L25 [Candidatus Omnitrophota bacterium]